MLAVVVQAVYGFTEERELAFPRELFYRGFAACSRDLVRQVLDVYGLQRSASSGILGSSAAAVRGKALFKIICPAGVKRAVFAFKDVDAGMVVAGGLPGGLCAARISGALRVFALLKPLCVRRSADICFRFFFDSGQNCHLLFLIHPLLLPEYKISKSRVHRVYDP